MPCHCAQELRRRVIDRIESGRSNAEVAALRDLEARRGGDDRAHSAIP